MKYIWILLFLSGCGKSDFTNFIGIRRFNVGDCLIQDSSSPEEWAKPEWKVIELGKRNYLIQKLRSERTEELGYGHLWEDFYQKLPCPKEE